MPAKKTVVKKAPVRKPTPKPKVPLYRSTKISLYHPYQGVRLEIGVPTACQLDSWLESQIKGGLITEVK